MHASHPELDTIHPDLHGMFQSPGGLFDVPACPMHANVNKRGRFLNPTCGEEREEFTVVSLQRDYRGEVCYRVVADTDTRKFGRVGSPNEVEIFDDAVKQ